MVTKQIERFLSIYDERKRKQKKKLKPIKIKIVLFFRNPINMTTQHIDQLKQNRKII